jgi:hypothetical protein
MSDAIPSDLLRKKRQWCKRQLLDKNKTKMGKMVRRRKLPCVPGSRLLYLERVVGDAVLISMERKKG